MIVIILVDVLKLQWILVHCIASFKELFEIVVVLIVFEAYVGWRECLFDDVIKILGVVVVLG